MILYNSGHHELPKPIKQNSTKHENFVRNKEKLLNCHLISFFLYVRECCTISSQKKKLGATEMWFY